MKHQFGKMSAFLLLVLGACFASHASFAQTRDLSQIVVDLEQKSLECTNAVQGRGYSGVCAQNCRIGAMQLKSHPEKWSEQEIQGYQDACDDLYDLVDFSPSALEDMAKINVLKEEMQEKSNACKNAAPYSKATILCHRRCRGMYTRLLNLNESATDDDVDTIVTACRDLYAETGLGQTQ